MSGSYFDYVSDYDDIECDTDYNNVKYRENLRQCDVELLDLVKDFVGDKDDLAIIDLGCGSGHQLYNLKKIFPDAILEGRDLASKLIDKCKVDPQLKGINFGVHDVTELLPESEHNKYDLVVITAVLQVLPFPLFNKAIDNVAKLLKPGGVFVSFEGYHDFDKIDCITYGIENVISERPPTSTMTYHYPSKKLAESYCLSAGFDSIQFRDFSMKTDLPYAASTPPSTHTIVTDGDKRLSMLGLLSQPWSFLVAVKPV